MLDISVLYQDPPVWRLHFVTLPCREGRGGSLSHTALCSEGGGYGRKDGDEDVEDFSPGGVVVES